MTNSQSTQLTSKNCSECSALRDALEFLYAKWEDGVPCTTDGDPDGGPLGHAFQLNDREEKWILSLIPKDSTNPQPPTLETCEQQPVAWRRYVDDPYEIRPRWLLTSVRPLVDASKWEPLYAPPTQKASELRGESRAEFERDRGFVRRCPKCNRDVSSGCNYCACPYPQSPAVSEGEPR